ncbi:PaaX family transcriptional regulator C-terminal domain-containing protein [Imperialibacter sp.]|uniref:PaaX family transcriptional regulator C-terminal domain-containing protein n=1 Tax=Imperialibacter sp. TaxID=2038411 RepID=UPI0032EBD963
MCRLCDNPSSVFFSRNDGYCPYRRQVFHDPHTPDSLLSREWPHTGIVSMWPPIHHFLLTVLRLAAISTPPRLSKACQGSQP